MPPLFRALALSVSLLFLAALPVRAQTADRPPTVVASIAPVHALAAAVMQGVATPHLLLPPGASPHAFALKPSQARVLSEAEVVFHVGAGLETFLEQPLRSLAGGARVVELARAPGVHRLPAREGGAWEADEHGHGDEHAHAHADIDPHMWLDPANARAWVSAMAAALAEADPANAATYAANAEAEIRRLAALEEDLAARLRPVADVPFVVFHDAYGYLEARFGLRSVGAVAVDPERQPGIRTVVALRERIRAVGAVCVFAEPQFEPALVRTVVEGTGARMATLDPLGARLEPGPDLYLRLMRDLADSLAGCLGG